MVKPLDRVLRLAENTVYAFVALLLVGTSIAVLAAVSYHLVRDLGGGHGIEPAVTATLDGLLLVFILLELVAGVRATMVERKLVAEPFLVVGIIASIKEIVVVALKSETDGGSQQAFENSMIEIGVLGGVVALLAAAGFLVRRKEREPTEG
ncbi:MAG: phosphate-starvation-inducible PsiE family protein [Acidimicrobiia bacterium]